MFLEAFADALDRVADAPRRLLLLDYDGTLVPLARRPELAAPTQALRELLRSLSALPATEVHVISGRARGDLDRWLGTLPVGLHAEHGCWRRDPDGRWHLAEGLSFALPEELIEDAVAIALASPGALIEVKSHAIAFHYRMVAPVLVRPFLDAVRARVLPQAPPELRWTQGDAVVELRPRAVHKGVAVAGLLATARHATCFAAGDDLTDEDLFAALPPEAVTVKIGPGPSQALFRVDSSASLVAALEALLRAISERQRTNRDGVGS